MSTHTPRRWWVERAHASHPMWFYIFAESADTEEQVISCARCGTEHGLIAQVLSPQQDEANARLIAAAPDLLEACKAVLAFMDSLRPHDPNDPLRAIQDRIHGPYRDKLKAAIQKAEGQ